MKNATVDVAVTDCLRTSESAVRVIVSHPARMTNIYQRARAAEKAGMLVRLLTGLYYRPERFPYSAVRFVPGERRTRILRQLEKRRIEGLSSENVVSLMGPALEVAFRPLKLISLWDAAHDWLAGRWISKLPDCDIPAIVHAFQHASARTLRAARSKGMVSLIEMTLPREDNMANWLPEANEADFVLAQSDYSVRLLVQAGIPRERILSLHLGVDVDRFQPRREARRPGPLRVLFMGSVGRRKGVPQLLQAWKEISPQDAELRIIGKSDTAEAAEILQSIPPGCEALGFVSDREHLDSLQQADLLVHPSLAEGGCNAVYEALACGIPCVVSANAGSAVRDGIEGLVVPAGDVAALGAAIQRLLRDPELRRKMSTAARQRAESLSWDRYDENLAGIYRALGDYSAGREGALAALSGYRF